MRIFLTAWSRGNWDVRRLWVFWPYFRLRRRRISVGEMPPCRAWRVGGCGISARNFGLVLRAMVSRSAFLTETTAATGLPLLVTTTGPRLAWRAYLASDPFACLRSMVVIAEFALRRYERCCVV